MINLQNMYISNANRISQYPLASTVTGDFEAGTWVELNATGEWVKAAGTKPAFICLSSRVTGGRDNITSANGLVTVLHGSYVLDTNVYDTDTYAIGDKLTLAAGKLKKVTSTERVFAEVLDKPASAGAPMRIVV